MMEFPTEIVQLSDLKPHPQNYQEHPPEQIEHISESIRANGIYRNVVIARENTILAGHGVVEALMKMGRTEVPVVRLDLDPTDPRALKVVAGDNEISHLAIRDDRALTELLKFVKEEDPVGLLGTGYDELMLSALVMVTRPKSEIADFDEAAEWVGMPEFEPELADNPKITINFRTQEDKVLFLKQTGIKPSGQNSAWWPPKEQDDRKAFKFDG